MKERDYGTIDLTKWSVCRRGPLTASGRDEAIASFVTKKEASDYAKSLEPGRQWRRWYTVKRKEGKT